MTMEIIERKARDLRAKNTRELFRNLAATFIVAIIALAGIVRTNDPVIRLAFAIAIVWAVAGQVLLRKGMPFDLGLTNGVEFYQRELNRRRYFLGRILLYSLGPVALSIGTLIVVLGGMARDQGKSLRAIMPFCTAIAVWIVLVFVRRSRAQQDLRREIDDLKSIDYAGRKQ